MEIRFQVLGLPAAQGSKNPWGGEASKRLPGWRNDMRLRGYEAMKGEAPLEGPVLLRATFTFPRPKHHYGTGKNAEKVKLTAPSWKASAPDLDKLCRALGDALTGVVIRDDAQIVNLAMVKIFGPHPGVVVEVRPLI